MYDIFYKSLERTNDIEQAIKDVEIEILKRKTYLSAVENVDTEEIRKKIDNIIKLQKKIKILDELL